MMPLPQKDGQTDYGFMSKLLGSFSLANTGPTAFKAISNPGGMMFDAAKGLASQAYSGFTAPHDAMTGKLDPLSQEGSNRAMDLAFTSPLGGLAVAPEKAALGTGVRGDVRALGDILSEQLNGPAKPFFSQLSKTVETSPLTSAHGNQWLGTLRNAGVKPDEMAWTGTDEWLARQKGPVSKQALQDHINANQVNVQEVVKQEKPGDWYDAQQQWDRGPSRAGAPKFSQYQLPGGENYREMLLTLPNKKIEAARARDIYIGENDKEFRSSHFDEPNVLAHVRFNDRVDAAGKKTLFIEEVQSDWHQKGRKQGYAVKVDIPAIKQRQTELIGLMDDAMRKVPRDVFAKGNFKALDWVDQNIPASVQWQRELSTIGDQLHINRVAVPDAPFKTTWPELALKRMVKYAADNGYDQVAWTPGKVQADRYDLSKQVGSIDYAKLGKNEWEVRVFNKDGTGIVANKRLSAEEMPDFVGKEVTDKITKGKDEGSLSGLDLQVGGEGMAAFYDKMLPNAANKLGKKFGAKVGVTKIDGGLPIATGRANAEMAKLRGDTTHEVWSLPITDAMRSQAKTKGFPLFSNPASASLGSILSQALQDQQQ